MTRLSAALKGWSRVDPRRSLLLCALGAVLGLAIAGYGLFTAGGTRIAGVPAEDVAIVNGVPILRADYVQQLRALHDVSPAEATPAQRREVLEGMIREELFVQRGIELGVPADDTDVRAALVTATEAMTTADVLATQPAPQELRDFYLRHRDKYAIEGTMLLRDYVLPAGGSATDAQAASAVLRRDGRPPAVLADSGAMGDGEEFYFAARLHLGEPRFRAATSLPDGAISAPVEVDGRWHIVRMIRNVPPKPNSFELVRDQVLADFQKARGVQVQASNERFLRRRADVQVAGDLQ